MFTSQERRILPLNDLPLNDTSSTGRTPPTAVILSINIASFILPACLIILIYEPFGITLDVVLLMQLLFVKFTNVLFEKLPFGKESQNT